MLTQLQSIFEQGQQLELDKFGEPSSKDLETATAVVLVYIAQADNHLHPEEIKVLVGSLSKYFQLSDEQSAHSIQVADFLRRDSDKLEYFTSLLKHHFEISQRTTILALIWKVVEADGFISKLETYMAKRLTGMLGLDESHLDQAREMVKAGVV